MAVCNLRQRGRAYVVDAIFVQLLSLFGCVEEAGGVNAMSGTCWQALPATAATLAELVT